MQVKSYTIMVKICAEHVQLNSVSSSTAKSNQCSLTNQSTFPLVLPSPHCLRSESKDKRLICHLSPSSRPNQSTIVSVCHCPNQTLNSLLDFNGTGAAQDLHNHLINERQMALVFYRGSLWF